ncbi:MAG: Biotin synthase, partial [Chlamydiae bacterium]|nr:Biotin synthase [Chlamydiota bacterium]
MSLCAKKRSVRTDWKREEVRDLYFSPLIDLIHQGAEITRQNFNPTKMQTCQLLSIKTGGCSENCSYCSQSAHNTTEVKPQKLLELNDVLTKAREAKEMGNTRFCMGAAWSKVRDSNDFENILEMVSKIKAMGLEVCCTLGMLNKEQARKLKEAGLTAYNHNLDTGPNHYPNIVTTRSYDDRLNTLSNLTEAGINVCCGGILGIGESDEDRVDLLHTIATLPKHPESVPINCLVAIEGTPMQDQKPVEIWETIRMVATARILMPKTKIRLAAGRLNMSDAEQTLCFIAGANSIFVGEKFLTTPNRA